MKYEELITELCDVIKESEVNAALIYENLESIQSTIDDTKLAQKTKRSIEKKVSESLGLLQHQDLHRQKIERVVNYVCEHNNIDKSQYNLADSAKYLAGDSSSDVVSEDELEELIRQMAAN